MPRPVQADAGRLPAVESYFNGRSDRSSRLQSAPDSAVQLPIAADTQPPTICTVWYAAIPTSAQSVIEMIATTAFFFIVQASPPNGFICIIAGL